ncbi:unnamed protein product [Cylicocyclus nassatus]|uniref:Calponin-homology (CH) domain-containing protein n=1 Tax=Cylicocyclus nassatus TaxID=53992 RepID=A0AA36GYA1_CYLNA|nr:unnamed protein product [Cylicocyclus nassatus]
MLMFTPSECGFILSWFCHKKEIYLRQMPEMSLSPVKWRRRSWRTMVAAARKEPITPSVPVSTRVQELEKRSSNENEEGTNVKLMLQSILDMLSMQNNSHEKLDNETSNTNEELQATAAELEEIRMILLMTERKCAAMQKKNDNLKAENNALKKQVRYAGEVHKRKTCKERPLTLSQSFDSGRHDCETFLNHEKSVAELQEKITLLNAELQEKEALIESERSAHKAQLRDFITAVKVAERCREEAQLELTRLIKACRSVSTPDEALWFEVMQKFKRNSKRNALLAWAQAHLTAYPSISVSNFTNDWSDGRAFCALVHHFRPDMVERIMLLQRDVCPHLAVDLAAKLKIQLDQNIFTESKPDFRQVMAAVFELYKKLEVEVAEEDC